MQTQSKYSERKAKQQQQMNRDSSFVYPFLKQKWENLKL